MLGKKTMFDTRWDIDKYKDNYDSEHWGLCRAFMETHKTKFPEQKLALLTEAFYQIGVYGSSYDPKTTRIVNALTVEVLDEILISHPGILKHPFNKSAVVTEPSVAESQPSKEDREPNQSSSIWDVQVDKNIVASVLQQAQMKELFKGFVIVYDIRRASTMNDNKVAILEESFKRSKYGPCHWAKDVTQNNICPIRMALKWRNVVLAEAVGSDEKSLKTRLAQAVLSKMANFSPGIEAKWSYYRDGRLPDRFDSPNPRKSHIYRVLRRSQFKDVAEITSYVDTFANSDSFAEVAFSMDFSTQEKKQLMEYIDKTWCTKLTYRTLSKVGVKNKSESHVFVYHIRTGEELRRWLQQSDGENDRYRIVPPGKHRRAGSCDSNVRETLTTDAVEPPKSNQPRESAEKQNKVRDTSTTAKQKAEKELKNNNITIEKEPHNKVDDIGTKEISKKNNTSEKTDKDSGKINKKSENKERDKDSEDKNKDVNKEDNKLPDSAVDGEDDLEKLLDGFVLFYDASKTSEIDKDDWFTALCDSFKLSKFGALEVVSENVRPLRTKCVFKWKDRTLASAEGLTETQAKTAATLQLISKLEPFTYIIQAKEEYFCEGNVPPFLQDPDPNQKDFFRMVQRKDLPSYYTIFQTIDDFARSQSHGEIIFGPDFSWELKNEIVVYLKAKGLSHRYFTVENQKPWTHMAIYQTINPEQLKDHLLKEGGENSKYKLIPPPKAEPLSIKTSEESKVKSAKDAEKTATPSVTKKPPVKVVEKRKPEVEPEPLAEEFEINKIQIKLKKFKVDKVDYPEDTGGDFPGLILWVGIRKNSTWQKNVFNILIESFKMSKYGELIIEESEESVWGRKEPFKKCVIKASRKVLAVGLGESKTEAKNSASLQVLRELRKHCYTIQAKESYFKEGKATPFDFNPDPTKSHVYKLTKRNQFKDRAAIVKYVSDFAKNSCSEEVIFGDDFTYDEREIILDHCRKINLNYRLIKCISASKNMHTHITIFHQRPPPVIKAELMKAGGENDMYRLVQPGGKISIQNNQARCIEKTTEDLKRRLLRCGGEDKRYCLIPPGKWDFERELWPDTLLNEKEAEEPKVNSQVQKIQVIQHGTSQQSVGPDQTPANFKPIPSLINRVPIIPSDQPENAVEPVESVSESNQDKNKTSVDVLKNNDKNVSSSTGSSQGLSTKPLKNQQKNPQNLQKQFQNNKPMGPQLPNNQPIESQPINNQPMGPQLLTNQPIVFQSDINQSIGPQPLHNPTIGPQPQFGPSPLIAEVQPFQEVPFGPQPLYIPPPIYGHGHPMPLMDTPLQFGPNPPGFMGMEMSTSMAGQMEFNQPFQDNSLIQNSTVPSTSQMHITAPSVTITVPNSPQKTDLREELAKKRHAENRGSPNRVVYDGSTERRVMNTDNDSDGWSRKVFVAEAGSSFEKEDHSRKTIRKPDDGNSLDLRAKLRYKEPIKEHEERMPRKNSPQDFQNRRRRVSPGGFNNKSMHFDQRRTSPERSSRNISKDSWKSRELSPEQRIIKHSESSHERRVFHNVTRNDRNRVQNNRPRSRSRSPSPRRRQRSPSPTVYRRDLWDNIPARLTESIFMYKYVKQDSTTETDPYALLRATRSPSFNVDFEFIKEQTAIDEWYVSVELVVDKTNAHPLVGEGMARTEKEASRRAALHAVDTVKKACRVIEPNYRYFSEGGVPEFIARKNPMKTSVYEIIQNMDPGTPLARYTVEMMLQMFMSSDLEDIFFLSDDFSYVERVLVVEMATQMNLWWRLFGPRLPNKNPDDVVSTQHVCVFKQKSALQLIRELVAKGGVTEKYHLVDPREYRLSRPGHNR